jgi:superfamily II DNA/RNA helicase
VILLNSVTSGFDAFPLSANLPAAIKAAGYRTPTPIQAQTIATTLARRDVIGTARGCHGLRDQLRRTGRVRAAA